MSRARGTRGSEKEDNVILHDELSPDSSEQEEYSSDDSITGDSDRNHNTNHSNSLFNDEPNAGFVPLEKDALTEKQREEILKKQEEEKSRKRKRSEEEEKKENAIKDKINRLICRYPGLILRSSVETMKRFADYTIDELENIYKNAITDIAQFRGTPSAEFVLYLITHYPDKRIKRMNGYTARCCADEELKRDIEEEMINLLGWADNKVNILFRLLNNAYKTYFGINDNEFKETNGLYQRATDHLTNNISQLNVHAPQVQSYIKPIELGGGEREEETTEEIEQPNYAQAFSI
jgi:hypothetical protein